MFNISHITKDWSEAGSFATQVNLYGFWDEHAFLTKSGDLGAALKIGGIDYESLDHAGRDYAVKRLEAALRSLDENSRLYQVLFKHNHPAIAHPQYEDRLIRAAADQRIPDARIEFDLPRASERDPASHQEQGSRTGHEDIEVLTAAYHRGHLHAKSQAGFRNYASSADRSSITAKIEDDHHLMENILEL